MSSADIDHVASILESDCIALVVIQNDCFVWANSAAHRVLGYAPGELNGKLIPQLHLDQESYEAFAKNVRDAIERDDVYCGVIPQRRRDGSIGWYEYSISRQKLHADRMVGTVSDRSASFALSRQLQESEKRYRAVLEDQTEVISRVLPDGTFLFVNEVYCRVFGKEAGELIGNRWHPVAHPDDLEMIETKLQMLNPDNPIVTIENRVYVAAGELRWMQFVNRGFFDADGCLSEIQSVGRDITCLKRAELALRRSEAALERAQRVAHIGSFALAGDTEHFTHTEETAWLFDLEDPHESSFADWFSRVHPEDQAAVEAAWRAALRGASYDMTYPVLSCEGRWYGFGHWPKSPSTRAATYSKASGRYRT